MTFTKLPDGYAIGLELEWDEEYPLVLLVLDEETEEVVHALCGIGLPFTVSDHGNIHLSDADWEELTLIAQELIEEPGGY